MEIPPELAATIAAWPGGTGRAWIDRLPSILADAQRRWDVAIGSPYTPGGATSFVAPASSPSGDLLVYKCTIPHDEAVGEADALRAYGGDGAVRVVASEPATFEILMERCESGASLWSVQGWRERAEVATGLMRRLWRPPADGRFTSLGELTRRWADVTARRLMTLEVPWITAPIERGIDLLTALPSSAGDPLLLHQDLHPGNVLSSVREPWLVIDPKPVVGDPAFDPVQLLVQANGRIGEPPLPDPISARLEVLGDALGLDPVRIALWTIARCAEWSMWSYERGDTIDAAIAYTWARTLDTIVPT
jgi:streptomycin 6-kinase